MSTLAAWYPWIKQTHIVLVVTSASLFTLRGVAVLAGAHWPMRTGVRVTSVMIDTALLTAGATLWAVLQLNLLRDSWLAAKLMLLVLYVILGTWALKRARTTAQRMAFLLAALLTLATMASIALTRQPLGFWHWA
jgi:uncharacterized membrane protein SirB2